MEKDKEEIRSYDKLLEVGLFGINSDFEWDLGSFKELATYQRVTIEISQQ